MPPCKHKHTHMNTHTKQFYGRHSKNLDSLSISSHATDFVMGFELPCPRERRQRTERENRSSSVGQLLPLVPRCLWSLTPWHTQLPLFSRGLILLYFSDPMWFGYCYPSETFNSLTLWTTQLSCSDHSCNPSTGLFLCPPSAGCFPESIFPRFPYLTSYLPQLIHDKASSSPSRPVILKPTPTQNSPQTALELFILLSPGNLCPNRLEALGSSISFLLQIEYLSPKFMLKPNCQCDGSRRWGITG